MRKITILTMLIFCSFISFGQSATPNSFLTFKLGMTLTDFQTQNTDAREGSYWVLFSEIHTQGMKVYSVNRQTSSGDKVKIDCCFYNDKLAVISIEYDGWQSGKAILDALKGKYGTYTSYDAFTWQDPLNKMSRKTEEVIWLKGNNILKFFYTQELGMVELVFADKAVQDILKAEKTKQNTSKIE
ncbi:MAG: hypothetical protein ACOCWB_07770 [Bacteroidota bacterium]